MSRQGTNAPRVSRRRVLQWAGASLAATAFAPLSNAAAADRVRREKISFDSDIGSDIDDAVALAYLLAQPRCELLGITTVTGEASERAALASALCHAAGKRRIPIFAGAEQPLLIEQGQPDAEQFEHIGSWRRKSRFVEYRAIEFMQDGTCGSILTPSQSSLRPQQRRCAYIRWM